MKKSIAVRAFLARTKEVTCYGRDFDPFHVYHVNAKDIDPVLSMEDFLSAAGIKKEAFSSSAWQDEIGTPHLVQQDFVTLAALLRKSVKIAREDGGGSYYHLYTAHPDGTLENPGPG